MQRLEDIRDFFGNPKPSSSSADDSESKSKGKKMKRVMVLDSDEEDAGTTQVPKKPHNDPSSSKSISNSKKNDEVLAKKIQLTTADDFFGATTVKQAKKPIDEFKKSSSESAGSKISSVKSPKKYPRDAEVHENPQFKEALAELDNDPLLSLKYNEAQVERISPTKMKSNSNKTVTVEKVGENKSPPAINAVQKTPSKSDIKRGEKSTPVKSTSKNKSNTTETSKTPTSTSKDSEPTSEKKASSRAAYWSFQNRQGPQSLGSKKLPRGPDDCLEGKSFVLTGVLESFERDEVKSFIERHGGKVVTTVSSKTSYVVVGREPGESKVSKAKKLGTELLDEDQLLQLVQKHVKDVDESVEKLKTETGKSPKIKVSPSKRNKATDSTRGTNNKDANIEDLCQEKPIEKCKTIEKVAKSETKSVRDETGKGLKQGPDYPSGVHQCLPAKQVAKGDSLLWADKYQATSMKQIIGQQGDKSNARKLLYWLTNWHSVFTHSTYKGVPANKDNGLIFRAALLSGVAGIGKTTTATIVCKELGFEMICMNASDTRSQKLLNNVVSETLKSGNLTSLMSSSGSNNTQLKHVLIMDEVDGMAGNEDRGGMSELIGLIKKSKVPVICICNDRQHQKVRSLANYCLDLRFQRPRIEQLKAAMMSMCFKEGLKIQPNALEQMIIGANQDVRQVIHHLQAWFCLQKPLTYDLAKEKATSAKKDQKMGPFDACRAAFCFGEDRRKMTMKDKLDLFFYDYSMMPLFMQENYLHTSLNRGSQKATMAAISKAADSFVYGDLASKIIRSTNNWSLLPKVGMYSCVIPGEACQGPMGQFVAFPQWLGQYSKRNKNDRMLQDLQVHTRLHVNASKHNLNMQIMPVLRRKFADCLNSLDENGIELGVQTLLDFDLTRDDLDTIFSLSQMSDQEDPWKLVSTKNKSAFTRLYNKLSYKSASITQVSKKRKRGTGDNEDADLVGEEGAENSSEKKEDEDDEDDDFIPGLISKKVPKKVVTDSVSTGGAKPKSKNTKKPAGQKAATKKVTASKKGSR